MSSPGNQPPRQLFLPDRRSLLALVRENEGRVRLEVDGKYLYVTDGIRAREDLAIKLAEHFVKNPYLLTEMQSRLENETSVAWPVELVDAPKTP